MSALARWSDPGAEQDLLGAIDISEPWALLQRFSQLMRLSGSDDERTAVQYLIRRLRLWDIPFTLHEPELFISTPRRADLRVITPAYARSVRCRPPSFSAATGDAALEGDLAHLPAGPAQASPDAGGWPATGAAAAGKVVLTDGYPDPGRLEAIAARGARAVLFVSPGEYIHEGACTPVWGAPDLDHDHRRPRIPVGAISRSDGLALLESLQKGPVTVRLKTYLDEGWVKCPILVAELPGQEEPENFVLLHGHLDSWHIGVGDNATGDACLLEVARVLGRHRGMLRRSVRIAWWSGHSQGRYAGSTWYADAFGPDLDAHAIVHVNCQSPGCRDATLYSHVVWHPECEEVARGAIRDATGQPGSGNRPPRAGDCSFQNIGVPTFFMHTSTMPPELVAQRGYYAVGGCGGNIAWHTEHDNLDVASQEVLLRDIRLYTLGVFRAANAPVHPLDYRRTAADLLAILRDYQDAAGTRFDLGPAVAECEELAADLDGFYGRAEALAAGKPSLAAAARTNAALRGLGRALIPVSYTRAGRFRHDPALPLPPLPDLAPARDLAGAPRGSHGEKVLLTHLLRGRNRVVGALRQARALAGGA